MAPSCTVIGCAFALYHTRIYKWAMKKIIINGLQNKPFLIVIFRSSLVKAAMNAAHVCKMCYGVNKTPQYLLFLMAKGVTKTIAQMSIAEGSSF
jgi:hypothetical protein